VPDQWKISFLPSLWEGLGEGLATANRNRNILAGFQPARKVFFRVSPVAAPPPLTPPKGRGIRDFTPGESASRSQLSPQLSKHH
jgi:hypothetical protein